MNNETHEDRVKILSEAPDGATCYDEHGDYIKYIGSDALWYDKCELEWCNLHSHAATRSLSDIQQLVDMQSDIDKWHKAYLTAMNEFDKKCKALNKRVAQVDELQNEIDRSRVGRENRDNEYWSMHSELEKLRSCIKGIIQADKDNSGYEPSLSVFQREISEAEELIND